MVADIRLGRSGGTVCQIIGILGSYLAQEWNVKPCRGGRRKSWRKTFCIVRLKSSWMK